MSNIDNELTMEEISSYVKRNQHKLLNSHNFQMKDKVKQIQEEKERIDEASVEEIDGKKYIIIQSSHF